ncbi:hypothetical protein ACFOTA_06775 [Chitinophaga sp. GCM10012297]|uniref:Replication protein n=1 Tax=Chitinophaga chungangae TaxID=2821488 RepID=A0ABS3YB63_9BACT|nr:hypothetical protein [Chitinophaga chungangae]MBO9151904.1 hypothetical protein [Chitinophaga chungangae]
MAKRFTDTDKWKKAFIKSLPAEYKLFWLYLLDECDHAGIWHVEFELAEVRLGVKLSKEKVRGLFKDRIFDFDNGSKWFIPDFISFQYGELTEKNRAHNSVLQQLKKYNLLKEGKVHISPLQGAKDKEQDKDKDKDKGGVGEIPFVANGYFPNEENRSLELPKNKAETAAERVRLTLKQSIDMTQVYGLWEVFKDQYFTGKKYYDNEGAIYQHFSNWIKDQKFTNGKSGKQTVAGSIDAIDAATAELLRDINEAAGQR